MCFTGSRLFTGRACRGDCRVCPRDGSPCRGGFSFLEPLRQQLGLPSAGPSLRLYADATHPPLPARLAREGKAHAGIRTMSLQLTAPPATEPVSLAQAKAWLRVESGNDEDDLITALIQAARVRCEWHTGRAFVTQGWTLWLDGIGDGLVSVPLPPLASVSAVAIRLTRTPTSVRSIPARSCRRSANWSKAAWTKVRNSPSRSAACHPKVIGLLLHS